MSAGGGRSGQVTEAARKAPGTKGRGNAGCLAVFGIGRELGVESTSSR
jgi:hypothetical protein